jgi:acid phosphatase
VKGSRRAGALAGMALACLTLAAIAAGTALVSTSEAAKPSPPSNCLSGSKDGKIKHVIYLQFDNVHWRRDNPNVPSDIEQMPHLLDFMTRNGTFNTNDHTVLISHTGGGILSTLTGLYPNRHGQGVSNSYNYFTPTGTGFSSSFKYWTDFTDAGNPAANPPTTSADPNYNMVNNDPPSLGGTGAVRNAPAPWPVFTRAGCDVGNVGVANTVLENNTSIVLRPSAQTTTLAADAPAGSTNVKVVSVDGLSAGQTVILDNARTNVELVKIASVGTAGAGGSGVTLTAPTTKAHTIAAPTATFTVYATDPTGDMTRVFGENSPEWIEGRNSQIAPSGTAARNLAQTDFVGYAIHCTKAPGSICAGNPNAKADPLPDEAGGYSGYQALFGAKYVNPAITGGSPSVNGINGQPITDQFNQPGFPGFDGMFPNNTLGEIAQMQEAGIPVTFGYLSDAHDMHGKAGEIHIAMGAGQKEYHDQLVAYDNAFAGFFDRLKQDGITKDNTLFVVTVEEGDHMAATAPDNPSCNGVTEFCTYSAPGHTVTEVNGDLKRLVATYNASRGTNATTSFSVHSDMAPNVWITGNPAPESSTTRTLEQALADMNVTNPLHGNQESLFAAMADRTEQRTLHMETADPLRTPSFTPFAQGDYFLNASSTTPCTTAGLPDLSACLFLPNTAGSTQTFAWNHGGIQPEINNTWIGWVGPGIEKNGGTENVWTDHTDVRPTILALLGLKDDYVSDGRVDTEFIKNDALPKSLRGGRAEELGQAWKMINAPFGPFAADTLIASTGATASHTLDDGTYLKTEQAIQDLTAKRDALADKIRLALWNAEFNGQKIDENQAKNWLGLADWYLGQARALAEKFRSTPADARELQKMNHIVVIYEENHSFDNLYGSWEGVNGISNADAAHTTQVNEAGNPYTCLKMNDVNLAALPPTCSDSTPGTPGGAFMSHFINAPFTIDDWLAPTDTTCPPTPLQAFSQSNGWLKGTGSAGGCTRDIVHRFYHEQYQLNGGMQNRYTTGSDAMGLTQGVYRTNALPIYTYLHDKHHPDYAIEDNFFQAAFGGSFLNHQWLIAAASPVDPTGAPGGANAARHPMLDTNGMPSSEPLYVPTISLTPDRELTANCSQTSTLPAPISQYACGNWGVNTMQPTYYPQGTFGAVIPPQTNPTIGDRLTEAGVDWSWYGGGWANADGEVNSPGYTNGSAPSNTPTGCSDPYVDPNSRNGVPAAHWPRCPSNVFQYHHQPFNYFANFSTDTPAGQANRAAHLQDEKVFQNLADASNKECQLKPVSFVKPFGTENEHPGYASEPNGSDHLVNLLSSIEDSKCAKDTMIIVAYDEFGGQWDHVPPPGQGNDNGPHDIWGPGTRIAALVVAPKLKGDFVVDSTEHDTTSILTTIEHRFGLQPLEQRDAANQDLSSVFVAPKFKP